MIMQLMKIIFRIHITRIKHCSRLISRPSTVIFASALQFWVLAIQKLVELSTKYKSSFIDEILLESKAFICVSFKIWTNKWKNIFPIDSNYRKNIKSINIILTGASTKTCMQSCKIRILLDFLLRVISFHRLIFLIQVILLLITTYNYYCS